MARSTMHRRYVRNPPRHNPPLFTDLVEYVVPGFAGFAATRFATRIATTQVAKMSAPWAKHAGAIASVGSFFAAWFLAHKIKLVEKYHTPVVVGSAIAALQSLIQIYLPSLGWMVADATPDLAAAAAQTQSQLTAPAAQLALQPTDEDPNEFTYNDAFDAGRYSPPQGAPRRASSGGGGPQTSPPAQDDLSDLALDDAIGSANLGVFAN